LNQRVRIRINGELLGRKCGYDLTDKGIRLLALFTLDKAIILLRFGSVEFAQRD